jgi:hypothetical protein
MKIRMTRTLADYDSQPKQADKPTTMQALSSLKLLPELLVAQRPPDW